MTIKKPKIPSLKQIFNRHTALPALFTIGMGIITASSAIHFIDYPTIVGGVWTLMAGAFTALNANSWKGRATGKPFFDLY